MIKFKKILTLIILGVLTVGMLPIPTNAKTASSARADNVFFYAQDMSGKDVLMKVISLDKLKALAHGNGDSGSNYTYSSTDNYPTVQYLEAKGITVQELIDYVKTNSKAEGASGLRYKGTDSMGFMATDSYGNYTRNWTANDLEGVKRYYFEGIYGEKGWNTGWEIAGEDNAKFGIGLEEYQSKYAGNDRYYADKKAVFAKGVEMPVILATESYSGRTTTEALNASSEPGIASYIAANGGVAAGSLASVLRDETALRLCIGMTESDLMTAHRTSYDNFKWIYRMRLTDKSSTVKSGGSVEAPQAEVKVSGDIMTITMSCKTEGAQIYYSFDGAPQILYKEPVNYNVKDRDLTSAPVTFYMCAVKEGWDDAGIITRKYPYSGVTFQTQYTAALGSNVVFKAESGVSDDDWKKWSSGIMAVSLKKSSGAAYDTLPENSYTINNKTKSIEFPAELFDAAGSYSFIVYAKGFANKKFSISMKKSVPEVKGGDFATGKPVTLTFDDKGYQNGLYIYVINGNDRTLIPITMLDRTSAGRITILEDYFHSDSGMMNGAGKYKLELTNNSYQPDSQLVDITLTGDADSAHTSVKGFTDVRPEDWFSESVAYVTDKKLFNGTGESFFSPHKSMTRAMFVTVIYRLDRQRNGERNDSSENRIIFSDVPTGSYYADAVAWAAKNGIVKGMSRSEFAPDVELTREQLSAILYRYGEYIKFGYNDAGSLEKFSDAGKISPYARESMRWAVGNGLIKGMKASALIPDGKAERAQVAAIIHRFNEMK